MARFLLLTLSLLATAAPAQRVGRTDFRAAGASQARDDQRAAELKRIEASPWRVQPAKQPDFSVNASTLAPARDQPNSSAGPQLKRSPNAADGSWTALRTPLLPVEMPAPRP